jgi:hypothetical protein
MANEGGDGIWVGLTKGAYDRDTGWHCPAIAGGKVVELRMNGRNIPLEDVRIEGNYVRFPHRPDDLANASVRIIQTATKRTIETPVVVAWIGFLGVLVTAVVALMNRPATSTEVVAPVTPEMRVPASLKLPASADASEVTAESSDAMQSVALSDDPMKPSATDLRRIFPTGRA